MLRSVRALPEEVLFFARIGAYGLFIGTVYWFASYEVAGTVLLLLFGVGGSGLAIILLRAAPPRTTEPGVAAPDTVSDPTGMTAPDAAGTAGDIATAADGPFGDASGRIPGPSFAPLEVGFGLALVALGIVFGPWLVLAAFVPLANGGHTWLLSASREFEATELDEEADGDALGAAVVAGRSASDN